MLTVSSYTGTPPLVKPASVLEDDPVFDLPVDSEQKATQIKIWSFANPHMRSFQLSWINFFMTFLATFAPAALLPLIRENLNLTKDEIGLAGTLSVIGAILGRVFMGTLLDHFGSRTGNAVVMLMFAPPIFLMAIVTNAEGFQVVRLFIGISLCCFICCQYWVGSMFNVRIVGTANAVAAGWGNLGGGVTAIIMPAIALGIEHSGVPSFTSWRYSFFIPGAIFLIMGAVTFMYGQDTPLGDVRTLKKKGILAPMRGSFISVFKAASFNHRTWLLALNYGYCFGVELTVDNIIVSYLYDQFALSLVTAGGLGALFGLMNLFSRATGGILSDLAALPWGMRGRIWVLFILQFLSGVFCLVMGELSTSLSGTIVTMIIFSIFCQQACGATFGIVPFVSRRSYGIVSGIVGAGGNVGAVVTQVIFFAGSVASPKMSVPRGLLWMGVMIMCVTCSLLFLHFPMWGSMIRLANPDATEEDYYVREWTAAEVSGGLHSGAMRFAMESKSMRGTIRGYKGYTARNKGMMCKPIPEGSEENGSLASEIILTPAGSKGAC